MSALKELCSDIEIGIDIQSCEQCGFIGNCDKTPFKCNVILINKVFYICFNAEIIKKCGLTDGEQDACIFHEIGHIIANKCENKPENTDLEVYCDNIAVKCGLRFEMYNALTKMSLTLGIHIDKKRLEKLVLFYRPSWTCGRYDAKFQVAIYYNLIVGMSHFFESYSAMVVGEILASQRNGMVDVEQISKKLNISMESLMPFFIQLEQLGIVISEESTSDVISNYRKCVSENNRKQAQTVEKTTQEKLPYQTSNAEQEYTKIVGGITSVMIELTYNCSEKCIHCYNLGATRNDDEISGRGSREELDLDDYKQLIDELYDQGLVKVCLSGGDPFSKHFAWDIIDYLYRKEIAFDIFTNGQCIVKDVDKLAGYFPRTVGVSLYSGIPEVHDFITRIPGSWKKSMIVIKQLSELAVPLNIKCCIMRPNVKSYSMVADIAKRYGVALQFEISLIDSIDGDKCVSKFLRLPSEQLEIVLRDDNIPLYVGSEAPNYGGQEKPSDSNPCGAGYNSLCITPEGNVIPCCSFHTLFGNVKNESITDVIQNSAELKYWQRLTLNDYDDCGRHNYCDFCNLCPGNNFIEFGTPLKASEVNCNMAKIRYDLAQKLKEGKDPLEGKTVKEKLDELPDYIPENIKRRLSHNYSDTRLKVGG